MVDILNVSKELVKSKLIIEIGKIRAMMDIDLKKAKQMATTLQDNLINERGVCFRLVR